MIAHFAAGQDAATAAVADLASVWLWVWEWDWVWVGVSVCLCLCGLQCGLINHDNNNISFCIFLGFLLPGSFFLIFFCFSFRRSQLACPNYCTANCQFPRQAGKIMQFSVVTSTACHLYLAPSLSRTLSQATCQLLEIIRQLQVF